MSPDRDTPEEIGAPVLGGDQVPRAPDAAPVTFVGGTGRSGTHVVAQLLSRNERLAVIPLEVRFHTDPDGFPGLLSGEVTLERFMKRLRGFWWRGFQFNRLRGRMRGLHRLVDQDRFDAAASQFERSFSDDQIAACRQLFFDLLWFRAEERPDGRGIVEQSTDAVAQAPTLLKVFPEARFIHVVRDGRDASASRVSQTRGLVEPRTRVGGIGWWLDRIQAIERGAEAVPPERLLTMSLDELLLVNRSRVALRPLFRFAGVHVSKPTRRYFRNRMSREQANVERWRRGLTLRQVRRIENLYAEALGQLETDRARSAPLLRRTWQRGRDPELSPLVYVYDRE